MAKLKVTMTGYIDIPDDSYPEGESPAEAEQKNFHDGDYGLEDLVDMMSTTESENFDRYPIEVVFKDV